MNVVETIPLSALAGGKGLDYSKEDHGNYGYKGQGTESGEKKHNSPSKKGQTKSDSSKSASGNSGDDGDDEHGPDNDGMKEEEIMK
jgi:hypothetical protein